MPMVECRNGRMVDLEVCYDKGLDAAARARSPKGKNVPVKPNRCTKCPLWRKRREAIATGALRFTDDDKELLRIMEDWPDPLTEHSFVIR